MKCKDNLIRYFRQFIFKVHSHKDTKAQSFSFKDLIKIKILQIPKAESYFRHELHYFPELFFSLADLADCNDFYLTKTAKIC